MRARRAADAALVTAAVLYGGTFLVVQEGVEDLTPAGFLALRFTLAAALLAPLALRALRRRGEPAGRLVRDASLPGGALFAGYLAQTAGLRTTTSSVSAFLTGLYSVFTPLLLAAGRRRLPDGRTLAGLAAAVAGLYLLTGADLRLGRGEVLTLVGALAFALWIVAQDAPARRHPAVALVTAQLAVVAAASWPAVAVSGLGEVTAVAVAAVVSTAVAATAVALVLQLWGQARVGASRTAVLLLLEPVAAGLLGRLAGEHLGASGVAGAALVLAAILAVETGSDAREGRPAAPARRSRPDPPAAR